MREPLNWRIRGQGLRRNVATTEATCKSERPIQRAAARGAALEPAVPKRAKNQRYLFGEGRGVSSGCGQVVSLARSFFQCQARSS